MGQTLFESKNPVEKSDETTTQTAFFYPLSLREEKE
jgi:hypothetical protein